MPEAVLICHPQSPSSLVETITVQFRHEAARLWLRFAVEGRVDDILWPVEAGSARTDGLWNHTCFEAFVTTDDGYREFNLSASGQWATYRFDAYREGMRPAEETIVIDGLDGGEDYLALEGWIDLPADAGRLALSSVIEDIDGEKTYWAVTHPSDKPDFHHPDSFTLTIPAPEPGQEAPQ